MDNVKMTPSQAVSTVGVTTDKLYKNPEFLEIFSGIFLGDGQLARLKRSASLRFGHSEPQWDYLKWKIELLSPFVGGKIELRPAFLHRDGYSRKAFRKFRTPFMSDLLPLAQDHYQWREGKLRKSISKEILTYITPLSLAIWWGDDGNLFGEGGSLATHDLGEDQNRMLVKWFNERYDIPVTLRYHVKNGYYLGFPMMAMIRLKALCGDFLPESMQYKFNLKGGARFNRAKSQSDLHGDMKLT